MIICYFNIVGCSIFPNKANTPLIVNANTHLSNPVTLQRFQAVAWGIFKVIQCLRSIQLAQFSQSSILHIARKFSGMKAIPNLFSFLAFE